MTDAKVVVYTSRNCVKCEQVLAKLSDWNVDFEERNITENREYFKELQNQKIYGTPATFIDGEKVLGFQERKLKRLLRIPFERRYVNTENLSY